MASQSVQKKELSCFRITFPSGLEIIMKPKFQKQDKIRAHKTTEKPFYGAKQDYFEFTYITLKVLQHAFLG